MGVLYKSGVRGGVVVGEGRKKDETRPTSL